MAPRNASHTVAARPLPSRGARIVIIMPTQAVALATDAPRVEWVERFGTPARASRSTNCFGRS